MGNTVKYLVIAIILTSGCRSRQVPPETEKPQRVKVIQVTREEVCIPVLSTGVLSSSEEVKLSFKTGGIIAEINVREGDRVKKGALLASLNLSEINAAVTQARNGYEKAQRDFDRARNLYRDSVATLEIKQNAATALDIARSNLDVAMFNLRHSGIVAPDNGLILKQLARENELISAGYPVFLFGASGKYWKVRTGLSDRDIIKINRGDSAYVTFDAYSSVKFPAIVDEVGEMADPYTGTYETGLRVNGKGYRLVSGFVAATEIYPSSKKTFTMVPVESIVEADGMQGYVYALRDSLIARKIRVNIEVPGTMTAISGLPDDITEVVSEGASWLKDGMKVTVVK